MDQRKRSEMSGDLGKIVELALRDPEALARVVAHAGEAEVAMALSDAKQDREPAERQTFGRFAVRNQPECRIGLHRLFRRRSQMKRFGRASCFVFLSVQTGR